MAPENHSPPVTRLAPSPTGALHLGNARTFLINWAMARRHGWRIVLRIEDFDTPRVKPETIDGTIGVLRWLGIDWDEGPIIQSDTIARHRDAMRTLAAGGHVFPSELTRRQIADAASAPHDDAKPSHENRFGAELRPATIPRSFDDPGTNWRFITADAPVAFVDGFAGAQSFNPAQSVGDFVVWTRNGAPAYQLAVVVDDAAQGVSAIIRGDDLLDSTARQLLLGRALGIAPAPSHWHLPLVLGHDGRRLAKRHGDTKLESYRDRGVAAARVIGLLASWCGGEREPMEAPDFAAWFDWSKLPRSPAMFSEGDEAWLTQS
jgi:glutamyl-tRNA synthetase